MTFRTANVVGECTLSETAYHKGFCTIPLHCDLFPYSDADSRSEGMPDQLGRHIDGALEQMSLKDRSLHEAACHACLFLPETSCERGNKYLDRSVLVPTVDRANLAFFEL